ncbi:putative rRNA-processing protein Fcf1/Utp23 [Helianthus annuus]|nr:putative rRNA-processing protein Fcf1/Utp23 [Helianthus annuus]KAJ0564226.1 putative rRNA-processing protein Fcf1/Utp23 [Helianthus annuus]KAJ0732289.1 putative rRNA-processing protein Fcf1/Utp23 [Helianthus annuus]
MRLKKQKRHRRSVRFFTTCYGFRSPFKILCDGTFIHHLLVNRITPADTAISNILGAPVKMFTTRCVLAELKSLGEAYSESLNVARDLAPARCDHEKRKSAVDCLSDVIGESNSEHFFVATQDVDLRRKFQEIPAVPVMFALRNALFLEPPSQSQQQFAKAAEEERSRLNELEIKMLSNKRKRSLETDEQADEAFPNETIVDLKKNVSTRKTDVKDKVQFKRKKAKGPNPLSCKKKKKDNQKPVAQKASSIFFLFICLSEPTVLLFDFR